jgi:hypothetical protein
MSRSGKANTARLFNKTRRLHVPRITPTIPIASQNNPQEALKPSPPVNNPVTNSIQVCIITFTLSRASRAPA